MEAAWTDADAARVLAGSATLNELAAERGVSRQAASQAFKRRGWATRPAAAGTSHGTTPTPAPAPAPVQGRAPVPCLLDSQAGAVASAVAANALLHAIANAERLLVGGQVGPSGMKQLVGAIGDALDGLERLGLLDPDERDGEVPSLQIVEMTAERVEEIRSRVETLFGQEFDTDADADAEDPLPGHLGAPLDADRPPAGTEVAPALRGLLDPPQTHNADMLSAGARSVDLGHLAGRLERLAAQRGRIDLRRLAVELGVQTAQATGEMISNILTAVRRDPTLASRLDAELDRAGL